MNDILVQARARWAEAAKACTTELAEAEARLDRVKAEAKRNSEEVAKANAKAASALTRDAKHDANAYPVDNFSFGPDPDSADDPAERAAEQAPQQAPAPAARRRPAGRAEEDDEQGPRIFRDDSW